MTARSGLRTTHCSGCMPYGGNVKLAQMLAEILRLWMWRISIRLTLAQTSAARFESQNRSVTNLTRTAHLYTAAYHWESLHDVVAPLNSKPKLERSRRYTGKGFCSAWPCLYQKPHDRKIVFLPSSSQSILKPVLQYSDSLHFPTKTPPTSPPECTSKSSSPPPSWPSQPCARPRR